MKRKVVNAAKLRLSPNEEAFILKEDYERRRKLRLLQVREQERDIALQIREDIKQRRSQQFTHLAEELRAEWEESQTQKIKNLEKLYLASLRNVGEGHRQAKENEPDLNALAWRAAERKKRAEARHKEALKEQKNQKEMLMKQKTRHIKARKKALLVEKERSAKITSLPPPPPSLFENIEVKRISSVKTSSSTYHHLYTLVNREMDAMQPDAHLAAEEEAKRLEDLQKQVAQERMEQFEKAHLRGFHAMKKIRFAQNQEKLMKELKQLQQEDLARRRQTVAQMPPQVVELPYKRNEMKEDWQRELEFAFEDMYNADRKVKGNLILHLEPEPLPTVIDQAQDEELDLSMEQENLSETESLQVTETEEICSSETDVPLAIKAQQDPSNILFKKLLNKIRSQKSLWTIKSTSEDESKEITAVNETESKALTVESETIASEERTLSGKEQVESDTLTIESGPLTSEAKPFSCSINSGKEQEMNETQPTTAVAQNSVLLHPQEEAARIRISARQKQLMEIEEQKQKQLELLEKIEKQKLRLETDCFRAHLEEEKRKKALQTQVDIVPASCDVISDEESHRQMIRNYQHQLLQQNRLHRQSVETAVKQLHEYQTMLKERCPSMLATSLTSIFSVPPQKSEGPTVTSQHWDHAQRPKLHPNEYQPLKPIQISKLEQDHFQVPKQNLIPQTQVETTETVSTSRVLAKQSLESQEHLRLFSQAETQQRDYKLVPKDSHRPSRTLSHDRLLILPDAKKISQTSRAMTFQTLDSQQVFLENSESMSSKLTEPSSFLPLAAEHSFSSLPAETESGRIQEPFSNREKSTVSLFHSVVSQMQDRSLRSSQHIVAQHSSLKTLQEQLELQKEVLRTRQEAQEQLLMCKQKELEEQIGLSLFPMVAPHSFASRPSAEAESGRIQESSPTKDTAVSSGHPVVPQFQDRLLSVSQPILLQQNNLKFPQEQWNIQRDSLQARREAQEVLFLHEQKELNRRVSFEQSEPSSVSSQIAQQTSLPFAETKYGKIKEQYSSKSEKGVLSSQCEILKSQDRSLSFQQQFPPRHDGLNLPQEQLTTQRESLQARHETQVELLLNRRKDLEDSKSGQISSSFSPMVAQCSLASQASAKAEPRRIQKLYLSDKEDIIPSSHLVIPTFQDKSLNFPRRGLPQQENLTTLQQQSHIQKVMLGAKQETQEFIHKQCELEKRITAEQTGPSSSLFQVAKSEPFQEFMSIKSDSTVPSSHSKIPRFQESLLRFSQHTLPLQGNLEEHQEWLDTEKKALHFSQKPQENVFSEQTGSSSFIPQLGQLSLTSLPSAESGTVQEPLSKQNDSKTSSSYSQIPQLQDRLLRISHLIRPQQDNLKALQEQLATQREAIIQSKRETQEEFLLHEQREWKERISPEQVGTSSFLPLAAQHSFASLPITESERTEELYPTKNDNTVSSGLSEVSKLPDRLLGLSKSVLPQPNNLIAPQEHMPLQTDALPSSEKTEKELVLPRQHKYEEKLLSDHYGDLKVLQEQLDIQRKSIRSSQEVQEEFLLQRLSKLEKRVLPVVNSERTKEPLPTTSKDVVTSDHLEMPGSQVSLLNLSQPVVAQQDNLTTLQEQLDFQRGVVYSDEKAQEKLLLNKQTKLNKSESSEHAVSSLFLPKETEHSFSPLLFGEAKSKSICELCSSKYEHILPSNDSTSRFQDRLLSFSQPVLAQQDNFGLQKQLDLQRKVLHCSQKTQEELLVQRQVALQQQMHKHQETLKDFFKDDQTGKSTVENDLQTQKMEQLREWFPYLQDLARDDQEGINYADRSNSHDNQLLSEDTVVKQSGEHLDKELVRRSSKPPLAKVKCGLDLNQHELSAIQEVESPGSGKTSILAKVKESVFENHAVLTYAVEEEKHTHLGPTVIPDSKVKTQEVSYEPLSSVTISTGSILSNENTDLSLIDPEEEFTSDQMHIRQIVDKYINEANLMPEKTDFRVPAVDLDFPELEHTFPNLHRQLFKPLESHPDFDLSSSPGISQDNTDFSKSSDSSSESHHATLSPESTVSNTAVRSTSLHSFLKRSLNQQYDPNTDHAEAQSFATENIIEGCEQSFQKLLLGFSSQEGSQHADLPSIFSIEARDSPQVMENQNCASEQNVILQIKEKSVHFQPSVENLLSSVFTSSDETNVFDKLNVQHSTPCGSISSECSIKEQLEDGKEKLHFEEVSERVVHERLPRQGPMKDDKNGTCRVLDINPYTEETDSQLWVRTVEMGTPVHIPHSLTSQNEKYFENSTKTETPEILRNLSQQAQSELLVSSASFSVQSSIPVWETESGHGIMEEPELTLVSSSDISIAEMDFEKLTLDDRENKAKNCFQASEFLPLLPEIETSDSPAMLEHSGEMPSPKHAENLVPECAALPGSLQEAFLKRKKSFIAKSSQRQKEIRDKIRVSEKSVKRVDKKSAGSSVNRLKSMTEVRVFLPEDRKTAEALMHQRTLRSYNQLSEVKQQKEAKARQEAYAQNRARAKEFQKKTLEKLRAKNAS
ncbi:centrosomal protein of 295 kDa isoform X3 [Choloepus didactylus]|uniref:centrosomal protein of 295 kDa isoform X3 n=1 Tax=Choloepus didactylus TaxID=27675 RepID=UPI00189D1062|nr:centrosomal protein of 295 kDa isoform X3 [Choloepus didactylus]